MWEGRKRTGMQKEKDSQQAKEKENRADWAGDARRVPRRRQQWRRAIRASWRQEGSCTPLALGPCWGGGVWEGGAGLRGKGPTLAVHAHGIKQAGASKLGAEQGHVQWQEPGIAVLARGQVQLAAAADSAGGGGTGLPGPAFRHRQETVHKVQLGLLDGVDEGVLPKEKGWP